jgi:hypothetical protein
MYDAGYFNGGGGGMGPAAEAPPLREVQQRGSNRARKGGSQMIYNHSIVIDRDGKRYKEVYCVPRPGYRLTYVRFKFPIDAMGQVNYQACETDAGVGRIRKAGRPTKAAVRADMELNAEPAAEVEEAAAEETETESEGE